MITIDQTQFFANLRLTQAYCQQQLEYKGKPGWIVLRSSINPVFDDGEWFAHMPGNADDPPIPWNQWRQIADPSYQHSFVELFNRQLESKIARSNEVIHTAIHQGRVIAVEYGENIPDGACEFETEGFFDEWDLPPIDTWFYNDYSATRGGVLFACIPEDFVEQATKAIEVQFLNILNWFEKPDDWVA